MSKGKFTLAVLHFYLSERAVLQTKSFVSVTLLHLFSFARTRNPFPEICIYGFKFLSSNNTLTLHYKGAVCF